MKNLDSKLLRHLKSAAPLAVSGEELSRGLGVSRSAVWKQVETLRTLGYVIDAAPREGYRFVRAPDRLFPDEIADGLRSRIVGCRIQCFATVDSTNRLARDLASGGAPEGTAVFAEEQTLGKGRLGRTWASPKQKGLYISLILRPLLEIPQIPKITLLSAVAVAEVLKETARVPALIRWPNDILVEGKKIAGILTEMDAETDRIRHVILGIGINVNSHARQLPEGGASLKMLTGRAWDRCALARALLGRLDAYYLKLKEGAFSEMVPLWESLSAVSGKRIEATTLHEKITGTALGIDEDGALWIRRESGLQSKLISGDIVFLR